jgi:hypothetical protein
MANSPRYMRPELSDDCTVALRSYLIRINDDGGGCRFPVACAVTAHDEADALALVRETYCHEHHALPAVTVQEGVTFEEVVQQIGDADYGVPVVRGIWYPHLSNP